MIAANNFIHIGDKLSRREFRFEPFIQSNNPLPIIINQLSDLCLNSNVTKVNFATYLFETSIQLDIQHELEKLGLSIKPCNDDTTSIWVVKEN